MNLFQQIVVLATVAFQATFTLPDGPITIVTGQRCFTCTTPGAIPDWNELKIWQDPTFQNRFTTGTPGTRVTVHFWTDDPNRTDELVRIFACNSGGCAEVSNYLLIATGLRDTLYAVTLGTMSNGLPVIGPMGWPRNSGPRNPDGSAQNPRSLALTQGFALSVGDSTMIRLWTQDEVVAQMLGYICSINGGRYPTAGLQRLCPP